MEKPPPPVPTLQAATACQACSANLPPSATPLGCGLCLSCRFITGDPFRPGRRLLAWGSLKAGQVKVLEVPFASMIDPRSGTLPYGHLVEARCLRIDAPEWRYELTHSWPSGISLFVDDARVLKKVPDAEHDEAPGPFDLSKYTVRNVYQTSTPLRVSAAISAKKSESWALGIILVEPLQRAQQIDLISQQVLALQAPLEQRMELDVQRVRMWVSAHRPDRVSKKDTLRCVEPPVIKLMDCTSLMRIETAARGLQCEHLQCFDLQSYLHTMRNIPPKHAWCCPVCDKPAPLHQLRLDAFAQSVVDKSADNVIEVLVADNGKWEVSATEDPVDDSSADEFDPNAPPAPPTQAQLQQMALNMGRPFAAPVAVKPLPPLPAKSPDSGRERDRSRSPKRAAVQKTAEAAPEEQAVDKMIAWRKLQGIHIEPEKPAEPEKLPEPVEEESRYGWLPEGTLCTLCEKAVVEKGGVYCGRKRPNASIGGCLKGYCWKCMNKRKDAIGSIRTNKSEFTDLGSDAWWMHEKCMSAEDKRLYFGEEDEDVGKIKDMEDSDSEPDGKFAWE